MIKIILVVGASGVGKDTLLKSIQNDIKANFVTRYITRVPDNNESNYYLDHDAFKVLKDNSFFVSSWEAHGNIYGISKNSIKDGLNIISISREAIKDFEEKFNDITTIEIGIPEELLYLRLKNRGREDEDSISKRIQRSRQQIEANNLIYFDNSKPLEESKVKFLHTILYLMAQQNPSL
jgi:phosphonate metabolism protein PhnN/1,5-bisphosphokinase (PRPP-forming)